MIPQPIIWTRQPQQYLAPDPRWLAKGLVRLIPWLSESPIDVVTGTFLSKTGSATFSTALTKFGKALSHGDSASTYFTLPIRTETVQSFSVGFAGVVTSTTSSGVFFRDNTASGGTIPLWLNAGFDLRIGGTDYTAAGTFNTNQPYSICVTSSPSAGLVYVDGALVLNGGAPGATALISPWSFRNSGGGAGARVSQSLFYLFDKPLSAADAIALTTNPWQLFAPIQRRIFVGVAGGGGTTYNDTVTETGSATDAIAGAASVATSVSETGSASDSATTAVTVTSALSASGSVADALADSGTQTFSESVTESGSASDSLEVEGGTSAQVVGGFLRKRDPWRDLPEVDWSLVQRRLEASVAKDRAEQQARNTRKLLLLMAA